MPQFLRAAAAAAVAVGVALGVASPAFASHLQGGFFTANVTASGHLQGTLTYLERTPCLSGVGSQINQSWSLTSPTSERITKSLVMTATRCITGSSTYVGSFDIPLDSTTFNNGTPDGEYLLNFNSSARVDGIVNLTGMGGTLRVQAQVHKVAGQASGAPNLASNAATGVGIGSTYSQNLNASDPDGGALAYATRLQPDDPDGPTTDVITLSPTGQVTIPAAVTAGFSAGQFYVYKVRVTDDQGDFADRDVLLKVGASNQQPAIAGLDGAYDVAAGGHREIHFTAPDPDSGDVVTLSAAGLPAWAELVTTPGNPATATLVLDPPAETAAGSYGIAVDAIDDSDDVPLTDSKTVQINVSAHTPASAPTITGTPATVARSATFTFSGDGPFECRVDGGDWAACTSPYTVSGVADGTHTFAVRQGDSEPATATFTLDTHAPAAPVLLAGAPTFEFSGEPGGTFECRFDSGAWTPCTSPVSSAGLTPGAHTFAVRQIDAAGNVGAGRSERFDVAGPSEPPAPTAPTTTGPPAPKRLIPVLNSTISTTRDSAKLGCRIPGAKVTSCSVKVYANVGGKRVLIGRGRTAGNGSSRAVVKVELNARGRRLVDRPGGIKASFALSAKAGGVALKATTTARMLPARTLVVPGNSLFDSGSGTLNAKGRAYVRGIAGQFDGVKTVTCVGYTDAVGDTVSNWTLGKQRAESVCAYLRKLGVKAAMKTSSEGEGYARASNATASGRALNRRVELNLDYRS